MTDRIGPTTPPHGSALGVCLCGSRWCVRAPRTRNCTGPAQPPFWIRAMRPSIQDAPGEGARRPATLQHARSTEMDGRSLVAGTWEEVLGIAPRDTGIGAAGTYGGQTLPSCLGQSAVAQPVRLAPVLRWCRPILRGASCRPSSDPYVQVRRKALGSLWPSSQRSAVANRSGAFRRPKPLAAAAANPASASDAPRFQPASVSPRKVKPT